MSVDPPSCPPSKCACLRRDATAVLREENAQDLWKRSAPPASRPAPAVDDLTVSPASLIGGPAPAAHPVAALPPARAARQPPASSRHGDSSGALGRALRLRPRRASGRQPSRERQEPGRAGRCVSILRSSGGHYSTSAPGAWGHRQLSSAPLPPWFTVPTTACAPVSTVTRSTRTTCWPLER